MLPVKCWRPQPIYGGFIYLKHKSILLTTVYIFFDILFNIISVLYSNIIWIWYNGGGYIANSMHSYFDVVLQLGSVRHTVENTINLSACSSAVHKKVR